MIAPKFYEILSIYLKALILYTHTHIYKNLGVYLPEDPFSEANMLKDWFSFLFKQVLSYSLLHQLFLVH